MTNEPRPISRRSFLKGVGAVGAGAAAVSLLGVGAFASGEAGGASGSPGGASGGPGGGGGAPGMSMSEEINYSHLIRQLEDWKIAPEPVDEAKITAEYETDVLIIGGGYAGNAACLELCEQGISVVLVENQAESSYALRGGDEGVINSSFCQEFWGAPEVDPVVFYNNWMLNCNNYANPELVMKFAQHGGESLDWHISRCTDAQKQSWQVKFWDHDNETVRPHVLGEIGPFKFWAPTLHPEQSTVYQVNRAFCEEQGAQYFYGCHAEYLLTEDDAVVGAVIFNNDTEDYFRVRAKNVIIATGGFGTNEGMMKELLPDLYAQLQSQDTMAQMGADRDGSGIAMATWAGAQYEHGAVPTMDGRQPWLDGSPGLTSAPGHPQGIFLDWQGRRFCNEFWGTLEHRCFPMLFTSRERMYCIYDDALPERMEYVAPSHGSTDPADGTLESIRTMLTEAYANRGKGTDIGSGETGSYSMLVYAGDTVEECLSYIPDLDDRVRANILSEWANYNAMCAAGQDTQFGRDPAVLFPLDKGPYYVQVVDSQATIGNLMVTVGGLWVDGEQRVLGPEWKPIHGLFASGNATSGRFGRDYFTPLMGVSIGMAVCLGRECGRSVTKQLRGELFYPDELA